MTVSSARRITALDLDRLQQLSADLAFVLRKGDLIALRGDLGAGKTTFARSLIRALANNPGLEVPSPTFTLVQTYETDRLAVAHFDLYRLQSASEADELGLRQAVADGIAVVEWPDRAEGEMPRDRLDIHLTEPQHASSAIALDVRDLALTGHGDWAVRLDRMMALRETLARAPGFSQSSRVKYIQGDASVRRYGRLGHRDGVSQIVMDWPRQPDGPAIRDGQPYSRIAHLAEGVTPFVAIAASLRDAGLQTPRVLAPNLDDGVLVLEDFGDTTFGAKLASGPWGGIDSLKSELWRAAVNVLLALRRQPAPSLISVANRQPYALPSFDRSAIEIEIDLLLEWYWPLGHGSPAPEQARREFYSAWNAVIERILASEQGWMVRDFHSPNLMWLSDRQGIDRVGILDFQDALRGPLAYDLVSLLQDARVDVPASLEAELLSYYCDRASELGTGAALFERETFLATYAALGTQRNTKILGIFARLLMRDGKAGYLVHVPRLWAYLDRNLAHPELTDVRSWYDRYFPVELRRARSLSSSQLSPEST